MINVVYFVEVCNLFLVCGSLCVIERVCYTYIMELDVSINLYEIAC